MYWMNMHDRPPHIANVMGCMHTERQQKSAWHHESPSI